MFDTLLIITYLALTILLASLFVCLPTLSLSINIKHICPFFHLLPILTDFLKFRPSIYFEPPRLLNLTKISDSPSYLTPLFIKHLRVKKELKKKSCGY